MTNPSATQTITAPSTSGVIPLQLKGNSTANANVFEVYDSTATPVLKGYFSAAGVLTLVTALGPTSGGTGQATYTLGDILYSNSANTLAKLAGNITATKNFLTQTGTGTVSATPAWGTIADGDVPSTLTRDSEINVQGTTSEISSSGSGPTPTLSLDTTVAQTDQAKSWSAAQNFKNVNAIRFADQFAEDDAGANIAAAIANLPPTGGTVDARGFEGDQTISDDIWDSTTRPVLLILGCATYAISAPQTVSSFSIIQGSGDCTTLSYTPTSGTAFTFNYIVDNSGGNATHEIGAGFRDLRLIGPGSGTPIGIFLGGTKGAEGARFSNVRIEGFDVGIKYGNYTWNTLVSSSFIHKNTTAVQVPTGLTSSGENLRFENTVFSHVSGSTTQVLLQYDSADVYFVNCSFDEAKFDQATGTAAIIGGHFENPGGGNYLYVNNGSNLNIYGTMFLQSDATPTGIGRIISVGNAGQNTSIVGAQFYSVGTITDAITSFGGRTAVIGTTQLSGFTNEVTNSGGTSILTVASNRGMGIISGGAIRSPMTTVTFSATPTFNASLGNSFKMTLTGNVTSSTISNAQTGEQITLILCQDSTGGRTMTWPTDVLNPVPLSLAASSCTSQVLTYDGTNWNGTGNALPNTAPAAAPTGSLYLMDDLVCYSASNSTLLLGCMNWISATNPGGAGSAGRIATTTGHPGLVRLRSGSSASSAGMLGLGSLVLSPPDAFKVRFYGMLEAVNSNVVAHAGLVYDSLYGTSTASACTNSNRGIYFERLGGDTDWYGVTCSGATADTRVDTGVAASTSYFCASVKRVDSATVAFAISSGCSNEGTYQCITTNSSAPSGCGSYSVVNATHVPTDSMTIAVSIQTAASTDETFVLDYADIAVTGLSR